MTSKNSRGHSEQSQDLFQATGTIEPIEIQEEMERSFLEYAMSVIVSRALPDVRDGLKPVHRRILYGMYDQNVRPDRPYIKCARVVGDVMGRFHPHGDAAIYDALVRMVQDFSLRYPLIDGHGSFGSTSPQDGPAAMRYTECRLTNLAMEMLAGIDEDTVDFVPNYDGSESEPVVLPSRFPNLIVNGSEGIAVGMSTKIPPHNLTEVVDALRYLLTHPDATSEDLMRFIKGPDFPTGALILGRHGIEELYKTGKGSIKMRAVAEIETTKTGNRIVVSEFAYQTSPEVIAEKIATLVKLGKLDGIAHVQNASAGRQPKLIIDLKRDAKPNIVLNNLYKNTPMEEIFPANMLALVDGVPKVLTLKQILQEYLNHQIVVVRRRSQFRLNKARSRAHIVEGLLKAIDMLDEVIATIRSSEDRSAARSALMAEPFFFSEEQANHILDMTLGRLTRLGRSELQEEMVRLMETIKELEAILADENKLKLVVSDELETMKEKFGDDRRTKITYETGEMAIEDLIADQELVITMTRAGYIKATDAQVFRTQSRGGRGIQGAKVKSEDLIQHIIYTTAHSYLLFFSNKGKVYKLRAHEVPMKERTAKGTPIVNLLPLESGEIVQAIVDTRDFSSKPYLLFATKKGIVKKSPFEEYNKSRREGFIAITLKEDDELVRVVPLAKDKDIICVTRNGMSIRFKESDVRLVSRTGQGVIGMKLKGNDEVVSCDVVDEANDLVLITDAGYGKRTKVDSIRVQARGGVGLRAIRLTAKKGYVVTAFMTNINCELLLVSSEGITIKIPIRQITSQGRSATGVKVMNLEPNQVVAAAALVSD